MESPANRIFIHIPLSTVRAPEESNKEGEGEGGARGAHEGRTFLFFLLRGRTPPQIAGTIGALRESHGDERSQG